VRILVTGGTGQLGRSLVAIARGEGIDVRILSRRPRPVDGPGPHTASGGDLEWTQADLATGEGLDGAVRGVGVIVHAATDPTNARTIDVPGTRRLVDAARAAGVEHLVYVSIVGVDRIPLDYYRAKLATEQIVGGGDVPFSIQRITQFHGFIDFLLGRLPRVPLILPVPAGFKVQSIATEDAARALVALATGPPRGRAADLGGPEALRLSDAARSWARARGLRKVVVPVPVPGATARALRRGYNTVPERLGAGETWSEWLERPR